MVQRFDRLDDVWPAGLGRRLGAMVYDGLLVLAIWIALAAGHVLVSRLLLDMPAAQLGVGVVQVASLRVLLLCGAFVFFAFFWMRGGMTLGMQAWRLRVQTTDGRAINLRQSLVRYLVGALSWAACGLGHLWVLFDAERRSWADIVSGTQVVVVPKAGT
ncbi:RDD family protein [Halomonas elongata]|uniref:RDD domain protein n=2 Tax=Halomonas elongata TaxID=2746 RepID=E1V6B5_HALED|nr:RDD family protein [Halomonas elongata]MBW5800852.1 RDD family protein [Halomonas elongata]MDL4862208.1 RDD family protein [Halomonas elongata]OBX38033.1 RDD family protein [Halomonas elongata]WBF18483.1 RDD family protein [Halomonas elongata]WPU47336.1 RDD family protein [Halomonas elongata DSM 2581]